jgi:archaeosine synthase beta-subunit
MTRPNTLPEWNRERIVAARPPRAATLDPFKPHAFFLEEEAAASGRVVNSGTILLTNKECPWRCLMCDLWKNTLTETVPPGAIPQQIEFALAQFGGSPEQIKLYNSGSFFDPAAIPFADYPAIARSVSGAKHVVVESHPRLVGEKALRLRDLLSGSLEVAMGLETIHPQVLPKLNKKFDLGHFSHAAEFLRKAGVALRAFVLVKPPFLGDAEGVEWAVKSAAFAFSCGAMSVSLIPTRGGNGAMERLRDTGEFAPPRLATLELALEQSLNLRVGRVFADLWDLERFSTCAVCFERRRKRLLAMNLSQKILPRVDCEICGGS